MAYDEGLAEILREELAGMPGIGEKRMFGGIAFMLNGNMLCGVHPGGGMFRVGKDNEEFALAVPGVRPMAFTGRPMGGFVEIDDENLADDTCRRRVMALALDFVQSLPAK
ncbi:TfoX/Sxy family protein [Sinisalibacter aestuarii]|uniref:Cold-shock protein n=1 Tax=Sinisalibacter aestuarii TaxID=2949426 RepID=A0ABQ5LSF5_9RHOB|nr:TfoX/Sxy family protein [Sinisalibacter aestuarii]GKY87930.1 cold-shock protein [Sinisalibacter aestuarii]